VRCRVIVPEHAPRAKTDAIRRLGAEPIAVPFDAWWKAMQDHAYPGMDGFFIHPFADPPVVAGNGTIGLEILEDLPDVDAVIVPWGGGGLACGIAAALRHLKPTVRVYACEPETASPLSVSLAAGAPSSVEPKPSFVDGMGGRSVLPEMWPMARDLIAGSLIVSLDQIMDAMRTLAARVRVVSEGAGAAPLGAALAHRLDARRIVCIVSGGNIDAVKFAEILAAGALA
jgi:threonine dehydratase